MSLYATEKLTPVVMGSFHFIPSNLESRVNVRFGLRDESRKTATEAGGMAVCPLLP